MKCPKCGKKAKQFQLSEEYKSIHGVRAKYYCGSCGWVEGYDFPFASVKGTYEKVKT